MVNKVEKPVANDGNGSGQDADTIAAALFSCAYSKELPSYGSDTASGADVPSLGSLLRNQTTDSGPVPQAGAQRGNIENGELLVPSISSLLDNTDSSCLPVDRRGWPHPPVTSQFLKKPQPTGSLVSNENAAPHPPLINNWPPRPREGGNENRPHPRPLENQLPPGPLPRPREGGSENGQHPRPLENQLPPGPLPRPREGGNESGPRPRPPLENQLPPVVAPRPTEGIHNSPRTPLDNTLPAPRPTEGLHDGTRTPIDNPPFKIDRDGNYPSPRTPIENPAKGREDRVIPLGDLLKDGINRPGEKFDKYENFDKSPRFRFPQDKPMDAKEAKDLAESAAKVIKETLAKGGELTRYDRDKLANALKYGIDHGYEGMDEMVKMINKELAGTGFEIKTDGKVSSWYQSCFPDRRGDYHGDFVWFDINKGGKKVETTNVKVAPGDFDRDWYRN
jgi:hypothetical protein